MTSLLRKVVGTSELSGKGAVYSWEGFWILACLSSQSKVTPASAPVPAPAAAPAMEKPIVLMKSREEGKGPAGTTEVSAQPPAAVAKVEKEGQRPTQPVYQIQNRGMGSTASSGIMDRKSGPKGNFFGWKHCICGSW